MLLTAAQFAQLVTDLHGIVPSPSERRGAVRAPVRAKVLLLRLSFSDRAVERHVQPVRDVSRGGIGVVTRKPLPIGEGVIALLDQAGESPFAMLTRVAWQREAGNGVFQFGLAFVRRMNTIEVDAVLGGDIEVINALIDFVKSVRLKDAAASRRRSTRAAG